MSFISPKFSILRRPQTLTLVTLIGNFCVGAVAVVLPRAAKEIVGVSPSVLGYYGFTMAAVYFFTASFSGRLGDRYGFHRMLTFAFPTWAVVFLIPVFALGKWGMFFAFGLVGFAYGLAWPSLEAALSENQTPAQMKRAMGVFNYAWMSSMTAGGLIGSMLFETHYALPLCLSAALALLAMVLIRLPRAMEIAPWGLPARFENSDRVPVSLQKRFVMLALIANLTSWVTISSFRVLLPEFTEPVQIIGWRYGLLSGAITIGMFLANGFCMVVHGWHYSLRVLVGAELASAVFLIFFVMTNSYPALVVLTILLGFPAGLYYFSSLFYGMDLSEKKGAHGSKHESLIGVGMAMGPPLGGWLIALSQSAGVSFATRANLLFCAGCFVAAAVVQGVLAARRQG